jgi:DNA-binding LytR/AlgR family response regulator
MNDGVNTPRALIVDDEPLLIEHLERELSTAWPELAIVGRARNGREALALAKEKSPDVVFLDIRMPGLSGLDVAVRLDPEAHIVFVTAFDEYAVAAFDAAAVDYLLKPVTSERLQRTVERLEQRLGSRTALDPRTLEALIARLSNRKRDYDDWLRVGKRDVIQLLPVSEVVYLEADLKYTSVFTADDEFLVRTPIKELEARLDPAVFWRIHRSTIVNANEVAEARRDMRGRYVLTLRRRKEKLKVSQPYGHLFRQM